LATVSVIFIQWLLFFLILEWIHQKLWRYCDVFSCCKCNWCPPYMGER
jgi:hypothetical protein